MRVLLTNDDGVKSPILYRVADTLVADHDLVVIAPSTDQSGKSHSFTHGHGKLLSYKQDATVPYPLYQVDGTPCDCIKFAVAHLLRDHLPDVVVSGINLGENAGASAIYSGTVAAARESALWGIPALAISMMGETEAQINFALDWLRRLLANAQTLPTPRTLWNINFPDCPPEEVMGAEFTSMSTVMFQDRYQETVSPHGIPGFLLAGKKAPHLFEPGSDDYALREKKISIAPLQLGQTGQVELAALRRNSEWLETLNPMRASA